MRTGNKKTDWGRLWKRNAVVAAIALFVCAAVRFFPGLRFLFG